MTPYPLSMVVWRDAHADRTSSWCRLSDLDTDDYIVRSVGHVIAGVKRGHVTLAQSVGDVGDDPELDHVLHIPIAMVLEVHHLTPTLVLPVEPVD